MRIGLFGGSFNPPHLGHLHLAVSVHDVLALDEVRLIPSKISPHRSMEAYAPEADRLAMCRLAAELYPWLYADDYELRQTRTSYTYYTVQHFAAHFPEDQLFLLVGSDMLLSFETWHCWQEILQHVTLVGMAREEGLTEQIEACAAKLRQYGEIQIVSVKSFAASSTKIRELAGKSMDYSCYLPEKIVQYIRMRNLYAGCDADVSGKGQNRIS